MNKLSNVCTIGRGARNISIKKWKINYFKITSRGYPFKNIFDFTTAGGWDCVAAVERLPALHYSVDFIFLSFGIMGFIVELQNY